MPRIAAPIPASALLIAATAAGALAFGTATPAAACTGSPADPPHCINNNQAIDGFSTFYQDNILNPFDPFGLFRPPANPGGPAGPPPGIAAFAAPGAVPSLGGSGTQETLTGYVDDEKKVLEFQQERLEAGQKRLAEEKAKREAVQAEYEAKKARYDRYAQETQDWQDGKITYDQLDPDNTAEGRGEAYKEALEARTDYEKALEAQSAAQRSVDNVERGIAQTEERIATAEASGSAPDAPTGLTGAFGGPDAGGDTGRGGGTSTFDELSGAGESFTLVAGTREGLWVDRSLSGEEASAFVRLAAGHAESGPGRDIVHGTSEGFEAMAEMFGGNAFEVTHTFMMEGLARNLRQAIERGEVPGTVEIVPARDRDGKPTGGYVYDITIPPEGLDEAKKYLDVMDSLEAGLREDHRTTESDIERADREEEQREDAERQQRMMQKLYPTTDADQKDAKDPTRVHSVIDDVQGIVALS